MKREEKNSAEIRRDGRSQRSWTVMSKDWRIILRFAMLGLATAASIYAYFAFLPGRTMDLDILVGGVSLILCPPSLLLLWCKDCELIKGGLAAAWSVIGLTNTVLYAIIGAAYVGLREKREGPASS